MKIKLLLILTFFVCAPSLLAQSAFVIPGSRPGTDSGIVSFSDGGSFLTRTLKDHSIYCRYRGTNNNDVNFSTTIICLSGTCPTGNLVGHADSGIDSSVSSNDALAFIADDNQDGPLNNRYQITFDTVSPSPGNIIVECFNTTLFGNFNTVTAANPFNFLELSNDSGIDISARIVITSNTGTEIARRNITIPAAAQRDISIHDIAGAANTFGRITVAHNGALHSLRAKLTKYTSSFVITDSSKLETRGNEE